MKDKLSEVAYHFYCTFRNTYHYNRIQGIKHIDIQIVRGRYGKLIYLYIDGVLVCAYGGDEVLRIFNRIGNFLNRME